MSDIQRWKSIKRLLGEALQQDASQRSQFLLQTCADDELMRKELESLLKHAEATEQGAFLENPVDTPVSLALPNQSTYATDSNLQVCPVCAAEISADISGSIPTNISELPSLIECKTCGCKLQIARSPMQPAILQSQTFDHFRLIRQVGSGGFGTVWQAEDTKLHRQVAIKIPHVGRTSTSVRDDFLHEAQALAQLKHPHIVAIHEVGQLQDSFYIVSDFVDGTTLSEFPMKREFDFYQIAKLLESIARAIHYSHEKGVIHRDLKPGNVMLDGQGEPHIMDFGLAKHESVEVTVTTDGQILGTPAYMSPEQASGRSHLADRRTDIYSLGIMLFELLTEELPFRGSISTLVHQIVHELPPSPRKLNPRIPIDLETICLKCIEKEPRLRFQTAETLADELRRFHQHEPIRSRPIGIAGRLTRWKRRNPAIALLVASLAVVLLATAIGSVMVAVHQANLAKQAEESRDEISRKNDELIAANELARKKSVQTVTAVYDFFTDVSQSEELLSGTPGTHALREQLLRRAEDYYAAFVDEDDSSSNQQLLADASAQLAGIRMTLGDLTAAKTGYSDALTRLQKLSAIDPNDVQLRRSIAKMHCNLTSCLLEQMQFEEAAKHSETAIDIWKQIESTGHALADDDIDGLASANNGIALSLLKRGKPQESIKFARVAESHYESISKGDSESDFRSELATTHFGLANAYSSAGEYKQAATFYKKAIKRFQQLTELHPNRFRLQNDLAMAHANLGMVENSRRKFRTATKHYEQASAVYEKLHVENPRVLEYGDALLQVRGNLGILYEKQGKLSEAKQHLESAIQQKGTSPEKRGAARNNLALLYYKLKRPEDAYRQFEIMIDELEEVLSDAPNNTAARHKLATAYDNLASVCKQLPEKPIDSLELYRKAITVRRELVAIAPLPKYRKGLAKSLMSLATLESENNANEDANRHFEESVEVWRQLTVDFGTADHYAGHGSTIVSWLHFQIHADHEFAVVPALVKESRNSIDAALQKDSSHPLAYIAQQNLNYKEAEIYRQIAWKLATSADKEQRDGPRALEYAQRAVTLSGQLVTRKCYDTLAAALAENAKFDTALEAVDKAIELANKFAPDQSEELRKRRQLYENKKPFRME